MRLLLLLIFVMPYYSYAQMGSVSGNVFWKYNEYVGNKPDAGSSIYLYSLTDTTIKFETKCDVMGNYKIEQIMPGRYFLIIKSYNTTQNPIWFTPILKFYKHQIDTALQIKISEYNSDLQDKMDSIYKAYNDITLEYAQQKIKLGKYLKETERLKKEHNQIQNLFLKSLPSEYQLKLDIFSSIHKSFEYKIIQVLPNRNETIITDFGITYI